MEKWGTVKARYIMRMRETTLFLSTLLLLATPFSGLATRGGIGIPYWGPFLSCGYGDEPTCNICEMFHTFQHIVYFGITVIVFAGAPILLVVGGLLYALAGGSSLATLEGGKQGNPKLLNTAKSLFAGAGWGVVIALGGYVILNTLFTVTGLVGAGEVDIGWGTIQCSP